MINDYTSMSITMHANISIWWTFHLTTLLLKKQQKNKIDISILSFEKPIHSPEEKII